MRKSAVILALALGFSMSNLNATNATNATNALNASNFEDIIIKTVEVNALCKAVATGDLEKVKQLIKNGVDVNVKSNGMQPIHYAAKFNRVDMIKVLITAGSEIHTPCDKGYTALNHAKKTNAKDAELFLKRFKNKNVWK